MNDNLKTKEQPIRELEDLRRRIAELEKSETERQRAEEALIRSEERYRTILDNTREGYYENDLAGNFTLVNDAECHDLGYTREELIGMNYKQYTDETAAKKLYELFNGVFRTGEPIRAFEGEFIKKDGTKGFNQVSVSLIRNQEGKPVGFRGLSRDITERKRAEEQVHRQNKLLAAINSVFSKMLTTDSKEAVAKICLEVAQELTDSKLGFIGEITPKGLYMSTYSTDLGWKACRIPKPHANLLLKDMVIRGIWGQVILKEQSLIVNDPVSYPDRVGIPEGHPFLTSFLGVPLKDQGKVIGMFALANNASGYTEKHRQDMEALSVAFMEVLGRQKAEEELLRTLESLRKAFGATIQVMVSAVEARDPYTAGHQLRSAELARAIAAEMGLPEEKIDGIRMAGSIHDIGKLSIPAEILTKPTKLTTFEFSMIKEHSRKGYEMLKDVESPWPLAQIVYQHHERMNGTGYPRNLKGDEILMDARIMAVADVVEAMASFRPYRPALGIKKALEEISQNRDLLYDPEVVDACLRLFREKGFKFQ